LRKVAVAALAVLLLAGRSSAEEPTKRIEKWITPDGSLYFGDNPPDGSKQIGGEGRIRYPFGSKAGAFRIQRVWQKGDHGYAAISYWNNTDDVLRRVTFECTAYGRDDAEIGKGAGSLLAEKVGPIRPGAKGVREVAVPLRARVLKRMACTATGAVDTTAPSQPAAVGASSSPRDESRSPIDLDHAR
jgi:hypothetical protein